MPSELHWNPPEIDDESARIISLPEHSFDVHYGQSREDGTMMPARPYMSVAAAEFPLVDVFTSQLQAEGGSFHDAFVNTGEALLEEVKGQIADEKWEWDRATVRSSGEVVGTPRNAVDTGELLKGQILEID